MTTAFLTYPFCSNATGSMAAINLPDRLAYVVNVKDYGAVGNGTTDDTTAIQAAFTAAFGSSAAPNGSSSQLNKPVFFPAGIYKTTAELSLYAVNSAWISGAGMNATEIRYSGTVGSTGRTSIIRTNGFANARVENMTFRMTGGNSSNDNTACFNWNWNRTIQPDVNTTNVDFINCAFRDATFGMLVADDDPAGTGWGEQCDAAAWWDCVFDNCQNGMKVGLQNALESGIFGGVFSNCSSIAFNIPGAAGHVPIFIGVKYENNYVDNWQFSQAPVTYIGCTTTGSTQFVAAAGLLSVIGCQQDSAGNDFVHSGGFGTFLIENCVSNGRFSGSADYYLRGNVLNSSVPIFTGTTGQVLAWEQSSGFTLTKLSTYTSAWFGEGLNLSVSDSSVGTWATALSSASGGGSNHVAIRRNTTGWSIYGA